MMAPNRTGLLSLAAIAVCSAGLSAQLSVPGGRNNKTMTNDGAQQASPSLNREVGLQWLRDAGPVAPGAASSHAGKNVAPAGDMNGDGFDDLLVASFATGDNAGPGSVHVLFGGEGKDVYELLGDDPQGSASGSSRSTLSGQAGFMPENGSLLILGVADGDRTGAGLAPAGDVDGDGFDDVLIGAPFADGSAGADTGAVWLVYGGDDLPPTLSLANPAEGRTTLFEGLFADDRLGLGLAGDLDLDGDGALDLALGAYHASTDGRNGQTTFPTFKGSVYVVLGDGEAFGASYDLAQVDASGLTLHGASAGDLFGRSLANAGDVNGDGLDDLLISAHNADPGGVANAGAAYLVYGESGLSGHMDMADNHEGLTCFEGDHEWGQLGKALAAGGDVNGDGHGDLLLGAPGWDAQAFGADSNEGRVYLVLGSDSAPGSMGVSELGSAVDGERSVGSSPAGGGSGRVSGMTGEHMARSFGGMVMSGEMPGHAIGAALALGGDVNGDGLSEMLIAGDNAGRTYLVHGAPSLPLELPLSELTSRGAVLVDQGGNAEALALVGDMNGDRYPEIAIGNPSAGDGAGQVQIVDGGAHVFVAVGELERGQSFDMIMHGTPHQQWLLMVSSTKRDTPQITGKGTWWLGDEFFEVLAGWHDAQGQTVHQVNVPDSPIFEGITVHWQTLETPQGRHQDLSLPLSTTIQ